MIILYQPVPETEAFALHVAYLELMGVPYRIIPLPPVSDDQVAWMDSTALPIVDIGHISESNL